MYFYIKNLQGNVMHIATADNTIVASYTYDAWGNIESVTGTLADTVGTINPIRYRGYYYDADTGLYYVSSRYYDAEIARFISADTTDVLTATPMGVTDKNLYAYCDNNPNYIIEVQSNEARALDQELLQFDFYLPEYNPADVAVLYNVPLYDQNGYSLCWAFCQVMVEDFQNGVVSTNDQATQRAIAISQSIYGENWNQGGWPTNSRDLFADTGINSLNDFI